MTYLPECIVDDWKSKFNVIRHAVDTTEENFRGYSISKLKRSERLASPRPLYQLDVVF